jgi:DNA replication and repair protein RecF
LTTVLFCPEDLSLVRDASAARRRCVDHAICQLRPRYAQALAEYHRLYEHKIRILRDWTQTPSLLSTLDDFNLRLAQTGAILIHYRAHFIKRLRECAPPIHADFSGGRENLELSYETVSTIQNPMAPPRELLDRLLLHQEQLRQAEQDSRQCLCGAHKDELLVMINAASARQYGSQGQTRTAALSLKLAQREIFQQETGEWPVLLLDDVLSELDGKRQAFVLNRIRGGQVFITCCEEEKLEGLELGKAFHVRQGRID